ncbi:MAG: zinc-dependent alcohol dehydrogenase [Bdellovibrionia bacterium]
MKAVCWYGRHDIRVEKVEDPRILNPKDAIVKVSATAICGSDLHIYDGEVPSMKKGDILGHEFMGEVVETGSDVQLLKIGDRVVVPFPISCGRCFFCQNEMYSLCDNTNPNAVNAEKFYGASGAGIFGYSHLNGGYSGGQAEFVRVPFADVGPIVIPDGVSDEQVLFLGDIFPTAYMAAENCGIGPGDVVAVWGCGPVGLLSIVSSFLLGAEKVIAIDKNEDRLKIARDECGAETLNYQDVAVFEKLTLLTGGRGPDSCIDAVGMEAHGHSFSTALTEAIRSCRKGGAVSIPGSYGGSFAHIPFGTAFAKGLTLKMGQTHVQKYSKHLLELIVAGRVDPSFIISHRLNLENAPYAYKTFHDKSDHCTKVVMSLDAFQKSH